MLELNIEEIREILETNKHSSVKLNSQLEGELFEELARLEELDNLDLDDCAGGACKL